MAGAESPAAATAAASDDVLAATGLSKRYGDRTVLRGLTFSAARGEKLAVIGPNGAGKTTLLSILAGIRPADAGTVSRPPAQVGWVPQQAGLYRRLSVRENLLLFARLERVDDVEATVERMLEVTQLRPRADDQVATLSGGNQQRLNIALGLLSDPPVLLLDEPSASLDPRQRARLWEFVGAQAGRGTTVVFSTHDVGEAERHADRVLVVADGEAIFHGTADELREVVVADVRAAGEQEVASDFESSFVTFLRHRGH